MAEPNTEFVVGKDRIVTGMCEAIGFKVLDNPKSIDLPNDASLEGR